MTGEPFGNQDRAAYRGRFDEDADAYDRTRPVAPGLVFEDLMRLCELTAGSALLEIGAGTGQATRPLAERGVRITALELGPALAARARSNLSDFPNARMLTTSFEEWTHASEPFDAVLACNAFHWLEPETRFANAAQLLRPGGYLALLSTPVVIPESAHRFWWDVQDDWEAAGGRREDPADRRPELFVDHAPLVRESAMFEEPSVVRRQFDVVMTAEEYSTNMSTQSGLKSLPPAGQREMVGRLRRRVEVLGGSLTVHHLAVLTVARLTQRR